MYRTYSLARIVEAQLTTEPYESDGLSVKDFFQDSLGVLCVGQIEQVILQIKDPIAAYVSERRWHDSQIIRRTEDGIILSMKVKMNDELVRWVLGLGLSAQVIAPVALQRLVYESAKEIARAYESKKEAA